MGRSCDSIPRHMTLDRSGFCVATTGAVNYAEQCRIWRSSINSFAAMRVEMPSIGDQGRHGFLHDGRDGGGDEGTGSDVAGYYEEDHVVSSGRDSRHQPSAYAALAGGLRGV